MGSGGVAGTTTGCLSDGCFLRRRRGGFLAGGVVEGVVDEQLTVGVRCC